MFFFLSLPMCFRCYGNLPSFHRLIMGKVEIGIYFCVTADILTKVLQKCSCSSPLQTIWILSKSLILIGCHFRKKYSKIFFSEVLRRMKLKLCINVCVIILYIIYGFYCCCACGFVAMLTLSFHRFIMGKVKVGLYFYICIWLYVFWQKLYSNVPWVVLYQPYELSLNCWIWLVAMANERLIFSCMQHLQYFCWIQPS